MIRLSSSSVAEGAATRGGGASWFNVVGSWGFLLGSASEARLARRYVRQEQRNFVFLARIVVIGNNAIRSE